MRISFPAGDDDAGRRLESILRRLLPAQSLNSLHRALRQGDIRLNGTKTSADTRVKSGDSVEIWHGLVHALRSPTPAPEQSPLPRDWIVYQGSDLVVINKPSGMLVHPGEKSVKTQQTLDALVRDWLLPNAAPSLSFRPGPLHRLDRQTSGLIVFSRTLYGAQAFSRALAQRQVKKTYLAILWGILPQPQEIDEPLQRDDVTLTTQKNDNGRQASTLFTPLAHSPNLTLTKVTLGTGRTHQIRAHAQSLGYPLAGDTKYGSVPPPAFFDVPWLLHAWKIDCDLLPPLVAALPQTRNNWIEKTFGHIPSKTRSELGIEAKKLSRPSNRRLLLSQAG